MEINIRLKELGILAYCNNCGHYVPLNAYDEHRELCLALIG
jgi:hypothetical protein